MNNARFCVQINNKKSTKRIWVTVSWLTNRSSKQRWDATVHSFFSGVCFAFSSFIVNRLPLLYSMFCPVSFSLSFSFFSVFFVSFFPGSLCLTLVTLLVFFLLLFPVSFPLKSPLFQTSPSFFLALLLSSLSFFPPLCVPFEWYL